MKRTYRYLACDFETTVYEGQTNTEVWLSGCGELFTDDLHVYGSIGELYKYFTSLNCHIIAYFHNLKFDGAFWIDFLLTKLKYEQAYQKLPGGKVKFVDDKDMRSKSFKYSISDRGQWYQIIIKYRKHYIILRDSLKLLPFALSDIAKSFKTKHQKLTMEYKGFRYAGCEVTAEEREYFKNDIYVLKEGLEFMFEQDHTKLTIGSCCLDEYKNILKRSTKLCALEYDELFPNLYDHGFSCVDHKYANIGEWVRRSYKGGWCYLVRGKENKVHENGYTLDVNSLYPSVMHSSSGNAYPIGLPTYWHGDFIPEQAKTETRYFFVRIRTRFYLKKGYLPFIQIKNNALYRGTEALETSDIFDPKDGQYYSHVCGNPVTVELTLTQTDYYLILEHYDLVDFQIIDGFYFHSMIGIFDEYIDKYKEIKMNSKGAVRTLAKLFLNNLYGKMATSTDSSFKVAYLKEPDEFGRQTVAYYPIEEHDKRPGYIPCGSAITSYAREFTIRAAQKNYYGPDRDGFIYSDTDSLHINLPLEEIKGVPLHPTEFNHWAVESKWDCGIYVRQKTYLEHITEKDILYDGERGIYESEVCDYLDVKCAGMPQRCKDLFVESMKEDRVYDESRSEEEKAFLYENQVPIVRTINDFKRGLKIPGKLLPKRMPGGVVLMDTYYEMR